MKIALGCDHGGFVLKRELGAFLKDMGHEVMDVGCFDTNSVDYPDIALAAANAVASGECDRGILVCGTGIGMSICANKVAKIRCALCCEPVSARLSREHNDANMLALGARIIGSELAKGIVSAFLEGEFLGERHSRRVAKITKLEDN